LFCKFILPQYFGKTSLSLSLLSSGSESHPAYINWDNPKGRKSLLQGELPAGQPLIILDEIHKFGRWRNLVKGLYDTNKSETSLLITGSAKMIDSGGDGNGNGCRELFMMIFVILN
jgi:predicted AAA+ superfamily ATPase